MFISHQKNAGQNHNIQYINKSFENVAKIIWEGNSTKKILYCMQKKLKAGLIRTMLDAVRSRVVYLLLYTYNCNFVPVVL